MKVQNDILTAVDRDGAAVLVLLDLSSAVDTIDHSILLSTLETRIGIEGTALQWFASYLSGRCQTVVIDGHMSSPKDLTYGVPQGSVLGPLLFTIYTSPLGDIIRSFNLELHLYADDAQIYMSFKPLVPSSTEACFRVIEECVSCIKQWMSSHYLKLNDDKTELIVFLPKRLQTKISLPNFCIGQCEIVPKSEVRNLGVIYDSSLSMEPHINNICRRAYYHLRNIGMIRRHLDAQTTVALVQAYVTSRLDYCNALLIGLPSHLIRKLQKVQNCAARLITQSKKSEHVTPLLHSLHWLPVHYRIQYKALLLVYKSLQGLAPQYLSDLFQSYTPARSLRSSDQGLLTVPVSRTRTYGDRSLQSAGPHLWNKLPSEMRTVPDLTSFKSYLKTYLFHEAFEHHV